MPAISSQRPRKAAPAAGQVRRRRLPLRWLGRAVFAAAVIVCLSLLGMVGWWASRQFTAHYAWRQAEKALEQYDFVEARRQLAHYVWLRPRDAGGHFLLARTCRRDKDFLAAEEHLERCVALSYDREAVALERVLLRAQAGDLRSVDAQLRKLLDEIHPEEALILEAVTRGNLQAHQLRNAYIWASIWISRHPRDWPAFLWRALSSELAREYASAIADCRRALEIKPDSSEAHLRLADLLFMEGRYQEAVIHYAESDRLVPGSDEILVRIAQCRRSQGDPAARAALDQLFAKRQDLAPGLVLRAQFDMDEEKPESALAWLRKAERIAAEESDVLHTLALVLRRLERDEEAARYEAKLREVRNKNDRLELIHRELVTRPDDLALRLEAAYILLELGRNAEAARWLVTISQMNPNYRPVYAGYAEYFRRMGKHDLAERHQRMAGGSEIPQPGRPGQPGLPEAIKKEP